MAKTQLGILIGPKGRGSNMLAIVAACQEGLLNADVRVVVSPKADTPAVLSALERGVRVEVVSPDSPSYGSDLLAVLDGCDVICLAGFLRLLPAEVLRSFPTILNVHPALLPKFGGKGMYGRYVHEAVLAAGETESGCSVHLVTEHYDEGRVLVQRRCPVLPEDTPETLAARVLAEEHQAYVEAIRSVIDGR